MWTAIYKDLCKLNQFSGDNEAMYKDIEQDKLLAFKVEEYGHEIVVAMDSGGFFIDGIQIEFDDYKDYPKQLVYFRRHVRTIGIGTSKDMSHDVHHCIGCKANINGRSVQHILQISNCPTMRFITKDI